MNTTSFLYASNTFAITDCSSLLLQPLHFCGNNWNTLINFSNHARVSTISRLAQQIIFGSLLAIATICALIPGIIGSVIKTCSAHPESYSESWSLQMDPTIIQRCQQLGINNIQQQNNVISRQIYNNRPSVVDRIHSIDTSITPDNARLITLRTKRASLLAITTNIISCFLVDSRPDGSKIHQITNWILHIPQSPPLSPQQINELHSIIISWSLLRLKITNDLNTMILELSR